MISASFDSTKTPLQELLARADKGSLQLPDFQRGWVWDDDRIRSLLASVSVSFPIGAVMLLQTGGEHVGFKPRPLTGTHPRLREVSPEALILDGQQRLTSLYQALMSASVVETKDDDKVDIHHIFPEKWCKATGMEPGTYNSIINKTALAARTNRQIGGRAPSVYLPAIERVAVVEAKRMDEILRSHCIAPGELRADRFWEFYAACAEALLQRIEAATGKTITREPELFRTGVVAETYDEGPEEWDAEEPLEEAAS
jgi:hypothetical protein